MDNVPELELQEELQRFVTQFADRVTQAAETLERSPLSDVRDEALKKTLLYVSSAMEIAAGANSEINLLDMIVFVHLSRTALEKHWIPRLYGKDGAELADVMTRSERELWTIAERVMSLEQRQQLESIIESWLAENPDQVRVEGIRLADFSAAAGAASERALQAKGLLSSVKKATQAANQALLLSERVLFLANRIPFLWRLQARLGAREMLGDALTQLSEGPQAPIPRLKVQANHLMRRGLTYVAVLGGAGMLLWWLGSFIRK